jgi:uncharacterized protein (DUF1697 family)
MPRYIAFLRAINVSTHVVSMERLRSLFTSFGLQDVETFINSGNVIFRSNSTPGALQKKIEGCLGKALGYEVATFLRTDSEVAEITEQRPFAESAVKAAGAYCVGFLAEPPAAGAQRKLMALRSEIDDLQARGREIYWLCRKKQSESDFSNAALEKALGVRSTLRGMNTVQRLAAKYPPSVGR